MGYNLSKMRGDKNEKKYLVLSGLLLGIGVLFFMCTLLEVLGEKEISGYEVKRTINIDEMLKIEGEPQIVLNERVITQKKEKDSKKESKEKEITGKEVIKKMKLSKKTKQIVTVIAKGTSAKITLWEKQKGDWTKIFSTKGYVGSAGIGPADEYHSYTPKGAYSLGFAFGTVKTKTSLKFRKITKKSYWISNVNDPDYNTWQERKKSSTKDEHLIDYPKAYKYGIVINYNKKCKPGKGSAFFLHCSTNRPTAGCVSVPEKYMKKFLKELKPGAYIVNVKTEKDLLNY